MFRFFRKHSWILVITLTLTIVSFVVFMGAGPAARNNGGGRGGDADYGTIYGHTITAADFEQAKRTFFLSYWQQTGGEWPDKNASVTAAQIDQQTYSYLLITEKAKQLGIHVDDNAVATAAGEFLSSPSLMRLFETRQPVPPAEFVQEVLAPHNLTVEDFQRSIRTRLAVSQMIQALGLPGVLVTPQEAGTLYDRETQEVSTEAAFFSASNYLAQTAVTPAAVAQFYTNNMAAYREPDRVQVSYVVFDVSNYLAQSKAEWAKTNFESMVESAYQKYGATEFASEKTPEAAKIKIRETLIRQRAGVDAEVDAKAFVTKLYAMEPVKPENLAALAKAEKVTLKTSAPFSANMGPEDFDAPAALTKAAFQLSADSPYAGPIPGTEALYVIALANQLPSAIPSFDEIHNRVVRDLTMQQAIALAQKAGTNFYFNAVVQLATGKKFPQIATAAGHPAVTLSPFSLSSPEVAGSQDRAEVGQLKQAAFTTEAGHLSRFVPTADGGFVLFVNSLLPVDQAKKTTEFPQYLSQIRRSRQSEAFNLWINSEFGREIGSKKFFQDEQARLSGTAAK
jgi:hypothetical protein